MWSPAGEDFIVGRERACPVPDVEQLEKVGDYTGRYLGWVSRRIRLTPEQTGMVRSEVDVAPKMLLKIPVASWIETTWFNYLLIMGADHHQLISYGSLTDYDDKVYGSLTIQLGGPTGEDDLKIEYPIVSPKLYIYKGKTNVTYPRGELKVEYDFRKCTDASDYFYEVRHPEMIDDPRLGLPDYRYADFDECPDLSLAILVYPHLPFNNRVGNAIGCGLKTPLKPAILPLDIRYT